MLFKLFGLPSRNNDNKNPVSKTDLSNVDERCIPILTAEQIYLTLKLESRISAIRKLTGISDQHFDLLYAPAIKSFVESAQLVPASASHHHSNLGGLVIHTLEVVEIALRLRKAKQLPLCADPETIADEEHQWTYGVFCAAILHDSGKLICSTILNLNNGEIWTPHSKRLLDTGATTYSISFLKPEYNLQQKASSTLLHLIPDVGRNWLVQNTEILQQLTSWLYGLHYEYGAIGEIARKADMTSVSKNLGINSTKRLSNAPTIPLIERLMTALRYLLETDNIKVNKNGAGAWVEGEHTYLVCGAIANKVIEHLHSMGASDIPTDNSRLFDTWQENGYALSTETGKAIWNVQIRNESLDKSENYDHRFTMLKFKTATLFHPSIKPSLFGGDIKVLSDAELITLKSKTDTPPPPAETNSPSVDCHNESEAPTPAVMSQPTDNNNDDDAPMYLNSDDDSTVANTSSESTQAKANAPAATTKNQSTESCTSSPIKIDTIYDEKLIDHFLFWIKLGLKNGRVQVNSKSAVLHITKEGVLLVSPRIFQKYVLDNELAETVEDSNDAKAESKEKRAFKLIQKRLEKSRLNIKAANKMNVHMYRINGANKIAKVRGFLVPNDLIFEDNEVPDINPVLENLTGILSQTKS